MSGFEINSYVNHRRCGICRVLEISPIPSDPNGTKYYVLQPLYGDDKNNLVRVPFDNPLSLREAMKKEEALSLIKTWPKDEGYYESDAKKRKLLYESILSKGDIPSMPAILKGILVKREKDEKLNSMDQNFLNKARPIIYGEIANALGITYEEVEPFIEDYKE